MPEPAEDEETMEESFERQLFGTSTYKPSNPAAAATPAAAGDASAIHDVHRIAPDTPASSNSNGKS